MPVSDKSVAYLQHNRKQNAKQWRVSKTKYFFFETNMSKRLQNCDINTEKTHVSYKYENINT